MSRLSDFLSMKPYIMMPPKIDPALATRLAKGTEIVYAVNSFFSKIPVKWQTHHYTESVYNLYPAYVIDKAFDSFPRRTGGDCDNEASWAEFWMGEVFYQATPPPLVWFIGHRVDDKGNKRSHQFYATICDRMVVKCRNVTAEALNAYTELVDVQVRG